MAGERAGRGPRGGGGVPTHRSSLGPGGAQAAEADVVSPEGGGVLAQLLEVHHGLLLWGGPRVSTPSRAAPRAAPRSPPHHGRRRLLAQAQPAPPDQRHPGEELPRQQLPQQRPARLPRGAQHEAGPTAAVTARRRHADGAAGGGAAAAAGRAQAGSGCGAARLGFRLPGVCCRESRRLPGGGLATGASCSSV